MIIENDLPSKVADLALQLSTQIGYWDNALTLIEKLKQEVALLKQDVALIKNRFVNHQTDLSETCQEFSKLKDLVATIREEFARILTIETKAIIENIENRYKEISSLSALNSKMISKFESLFEEIALDSKNALLKASNAEMLVMLNKKKVENVQLQVQNQQLKK